MKVKIVSLIDWLSWLVILHWCLGLEYQEDLKLRAMNDATARKDQEHLEVRLKSYKK